MVGARSIGRLGWLAAAVAAAASLGASPTEAAADPRQPLAASVGLAPPCAAPWRYRWQWRRAVVYRTSCRVCRFSSYEQIATVYGSQADPLLAAWAYARTFRRTYRQAAFDGCVRGFGIRYG